jgi:DNA (cytosine-5)-methyltransferase 1
VNRCPVCGAVGWILADLYSGAGGAGHGYGLAGFHIVGVDNRPQPRYPGCFILADALDVDIGPFDAYHASPPCSAHIRSRNPASIVHGTGYLLGATRERLQATGRPWVIENVPGAPMRADYRLCGCLYGLGDERFILLRERWFETSWGGFRLRSPCHHDRPACVNLTGGSWYRTPRPGRHKRYIDHATTSAIMGIDWMTRRELGNAIPPVYTADIGVDLMIRVGLAALAEAAAS